MEQYIHRCFDLAQRGKGRTAPNPMVGAVLVHGGRIIGEGWHHEYGADHAEVNCLKNVADEDSRLIEESTMYVNLEPCAHYGLTPPCANRLVAERIKKVVIANTDPFAQVGGKGIEILKSGGVEVETGVLEAAGKWLNRRFFCFHQQARPYIILKWAQTANGYFAPADRGRLQLTGPESGLLVHKWRTEESAIMVGTTTALSDNPQLTARQWKGKQPLRIALDRKQTIPKGHQLFNTDAPTWVVNAEAEYAEGNVAYVKLPFNDGLLPGLLERLHGARVLSLIVEGGANLLHSFIEAGLWDEARIFTTRTTMAGGVAAPLVGSCRVAFEAEIGVDNLKVLVNDRSEYPYAVGMEL